MNRNRPLPWHFLIKHPVAGLAFMAGRKSPAHRIQILETARGLWKDQAVTDRFDQALTELEGSSGRSALPSPGSDGGGNRPNTTFGKWIWCCVRVFQPEIMVETGVSHGHSSGNILDAMARNGKGRLYSIDLPNKDTNPDYNFKDPNNETGWAVPDHLRERWELILGDARNELPALLYRLGSIDMFFHDSDHSYEHMIFEFETCLPHLTGEGIILSDDIDKNEAFDHFTGKHGLTSHRFNKGGVAIVSR